MAALVGSAVPDVPLVDHTGASLGLHPASGWRVAFFFPGAFAPQHGYPPSWGRIPGAAGCTLEATTYADRHSAFSDAGRRGRRHQQPATRRAGRVPHPCIAAPTAWPPTRPDDSGLPFRLPVFRAAGIDRFKRQTLLLDPGGVVRHVQLPITDPAGAVDEMLAVVRSLV